MLVPFFAHAHEMIPTYPKWKTSIYDGLLVTEMEMFNKREDVEYYEIAVFDKDWNVIPFVSSFKLFRLEYLSKVKFEVFIRKQDKVRTEYICSTSKLRNNNAPAISSMICSRFK
jgi:hypothetical protein